MNKSLEIGDIVRRSKNSCKYTHMNHKDEYIIIKDHMYCFEIKQLNNGRVAYPSKNGLRLVKKGNNNE